MKGSWSFYQLSSCKLHANMHVKILKNSWIIFFFILMYHLHFIFFPWRLNELNFFKIHEVMYIFSTKFMIWIIIMIYQGFQVKIIDSLLSIIDFIENFPDCLKIIHEIIMRILVVVDAVFLNLTKNIQFL